MANLTREDIIGRKLGQRALELPDGGTVTVRGLSRNEAIAMQALEGIEARDSYLIWKGLVDPALSLEDVQEWAASDAAGTLVAVSEAIATLSKMTPAAAKESTKSVPRRK